MSNFSKGIYGSKSGSFLWFSYNTTWQKSLVSTELLQIVFPQVYREKNMKELSVNYSLLSTFLSRDLSMLILPQPFPLAFIFLFLVERFQNNPRAEQRLNQFGGGRWSLSLKSLFSCHNWRENTSGKSNYFYSWDK